MNLIAFDLDDTLYKEIDFLHSGYREITRQLSVDFRLDYNVMYDMMIHPQKNAFDDLNMYLRQHDVPSDRDVSWMVNVYRTHHPDITLDNETEHTLKLLTESTENRLAIITDGRIITQQAKIDALGLHRFIESNLISISESIGAKKNKRLPFERMMALNTDCNRFFYIGDNPAKDFYWGNKLGWTTIQLNDDGRNIQKQNIIIPQQYHAQLTVSSIADVIDYINCIAH